MRSTNNVTIIGRLTRDPEIRYSQGDNPIAIAKYTVAVNRRKKKGSSENETDFIQCVAFRDIAENAETYLRKGSLVGIGGEIRTGSYTNKEGQKVYTTELYVDSQQFLDSKGSKSASAEASATPSRPEPATDTDGFMNIPDAIEEELPFNV